MKGKRSWEKTKNNGNRRHRRAGVLPAALLVAAALLLPAALSGCSGNGGESGDGVVDETGQRQGQTLESEQELDQGQGLFSHPDYEEMKLNEWQPKEGYVESILYVDSRIAVLALAKEEPKGKGGGLPNPTEYLVLYDQKTGDEKEYELEGNSIAADAVPYREGFLFMEYNRAEGAPEADLFDWALYYAEEDLQCLDRSTQGTSVPSDLCLVDGTPVYVFETATAESEKGAKPYRVMAVDGLQVRTVWEETDCELNRSVVSGGSRFAFVFKKEGRYYIQIGDLEGRVKAIPAAEKHLQRFALTPDYLVYTTGWDEEDKVLHSIDLASGEEQTAALHLVFYSLIGGEQQKLLGNSGREIFSVDPRSMEIRQLYVPEDMEGSIRALYTEVLHEPEAVLDTSKGIYLIN